MNAATQPTKIPERPSTPINHPSKPGPATTTFAQSLTRPGHHSVSHSGRPVWQRLVARLNRLRKKSFSSGGRCFSADVYSVLSTGFSA